MASCENCNTKVPAGDLQVAKRGDESILVGPCCLSAVTTPVVTYHLEFSSANGLIATAEYAGLRIEYRKPASAVRQFIEMYTNPVESSNVTH